MKKLISIIILCLGCCGIFEAQNIWKPIDGTGILGVGPDGSIFAYSEYGALSRSQDEGETWQIVLGQETGFSGFINHSCFAVSNEGRICVFNDNLQTVVYSDDGGDTWQQTTTLSLCAMPTKTGICTTTNDIFVVWAENGEISYTLDGGETWEGWILESMDEDHQVSDMLVNTGDDVFVSVWSYSGEGSGIFHSTLSDMQSWELVAAEGLSIRDMAFDPEGNVVACGWNINGSIGFQHTPGFYLFDGTSLAIGDNGVVYTPHLTGLSAILSYSTDHGEHFTEIGEDLPLVDVNPGGEVGLLFGGYDNHLYFDGGGEYWKSILDADHIQGNFSLDNTVWVQFHRNLMLDWHPYIIGIKGDTVVDGLTYHKVIENPNYFPIEGHCFGGIREDEGGRWYFVDFSWPESLPICLIAGDQPGTEFPLYDFSLSVCDQYHFSGDEYGTEYLESVFQIDEMEINGNTRKLYWFDNNCEQGEHYYGHDWIEGIGSNYGLLYPLQLCPLDGSEYHLSEVWQNGGLIYRNPIFEEELEPLVAEGKQWNVAFSYPWFPPEPQQHYTTAYKVEGDTVVDGTAYKMLLYTRSEHFTNWAFCGVLRETNEGQVFYRGYGNHVFGEEEMLYDFSMQPGDSIQYYDESESYLVLVNVSDTLMENDYMPRKKFVLQYKEGGYLWDGYYETWIEGIGSLYGLLNVGSLFLVGGWYNLLCYYEDGSLVFQNPDFNSCYMGTDGVDENETESLITAYPNPTHHVLFVEMQDFASLSNKTYHITNLMGQTLMSGHITTETQQINVSELPQGMYFISIGNMTRKFVVNR